MANANEMLLLKLINDPALIKTLEKLTKANAGSAKKKEKAFKEAGVPSYINRITIRCKTCSSERVDYTRMDWDMVDKLYRVGCYASENLWPTYPVRELIQRTSICKCCYDYLMNLDKDELVKKLIRAIERSYNHV